MSSPQPQARLIGLTRSLQDVTVTAGETATFQCELSYEGIAVDWFLGETKLEPSDRVSFQQPERRGTSLPVDTSSRRLHTASYKG